MSTRISVDEAAPLHSVRRGPPSKNRRLPSKETQANESSKFKTHAHKGRYMGKTTDSKKLCSYRGLNHTPQKSACPAADGTCLKCNKLGHFARVCRSKQTSTTTTKKPVKYVEEQEEVEYVRLNVIDTASTARKAFATFRAISTNEDIKFQIDTGASCNVLSFKDYARTTGDRKGQELLKTNTILVMHNNAHVRPKGTSWITVQQNGHTFRVHCYIVNGNGTPLLSLKSSQQLGLIKIVDSDTVNVVAEQTSSSNVLNDPVLRQYKDLFQGLGCLEEEYTIKLKPDAKPVVQPPRKAPVALREAVKEELARLTTEGVITPVTEPTAWVSAMVAVKKKNGKVRICIDPRDLNESIMREHYPLQTFEEVATRLPKARVFSVFDDAKTGFWQVKLDEASSYMLPCSTLHMVAIAGTECLLV